MGVPVPADDLPVSRVVPYDDLPNPTFGDTAKEALKGAGKNLLGIGENIANQVTQLGAMTVTAVPNILGSTGAELAQAVVEERIPTFKGIGDKFHANLQPQIYQPQTESGKHQVDTTGKIMTAIPAAVDAIDAAAGDPFKRNFPNTYAATQVAGEFAPWIVGGKAIHNAFAGPTSVVPKGQGVRVPVEDMPPRTEQAQEAPRQEAPRQEAPRQETPPKEEAPQPEPPPQDGPQYDTGQEPFSANRLMAEIKLAKDPNTSKSVVEIPETAPLNQKNIVRIARETGMQATQADGKYYLYNPAETTAKVVREAVAGDTKGNLLGYGTDAVPEAGIDYAVSLDGKGTVDLPTIKQWRDNDNLAFAGRALDEQMAVAKMQEMGAKQLEGGDAPWQRRKAEERSAEVVRPEYAINADGTLKTKNEYTPEEWKAYTDSVIEQKLNGPAAQDSASIVPPAGFERLTPQGKRGNQPAYQVNISPSQHQSLREMRQEISDGEAGKRTGTTMFQNDTGPNENVSWGSTYPEYFQDKGLTKKEVIPVFDRILNGEPVTERQWLMVEDMLKAKRYDTLNRILTDRAERRSESHRNMSDAEIQDALNAADDFFSQFGDKNETPAEVPRDVRTNDAGTAGRGDASPVNQDGVRTETVDASGWGQQVGIEGDTIRASFGEREQQGRRVGTSEFVDGFTPDPQQNLFGGKGHSDTGGYANRQQRPSTQPAIEMPELHKLARMLMNGEVPQLKERIGKALGRFTHDNTGNRDITLRKDIFAGEQIAGESFNRREWAKLDKEAWKEEVRKNNPDEDIIFREKYNRKTGDMDLKAYRRNPELAPKVLAHEIGHLIDYLPDFLVRGRGNILGHIAGLKKYLKHTMAMYDGAKGQPLTPQDRARIAKEARAELKDGVDIVETITREVPTYETVGITPEMITEIWNGMSDARTTSPDLYKFIAKMSDAEKKQVVVQAMKGIVDERLQQFGGRRQTGTETVTETKTRRQAGDPAAIRKRTQELIKEEIIKRRLYEKEVISGELKALTQTWKPFNTEANAEYTAHRHSPAELYADAVSVLFNEPNLLKQTAPTFYKSFMYYMKERPEVREAYKAMTERSRDPEVLGDARLQDRFDMYDRGDEKYNQKRKDEAGTESVSDTFLRVFSDENTLTKQQFDNTPQGKSARDRLEAIAYIPGEVSNYFLDQHGLRKGLQEKGISDNEFGAYLDLVHTAEHRTDIANSLGTTAESAKTELAALKRRVGDERFAAMQEAAQQFAGNRAKLFDTWKESGIITPGQHQMFSERSKYVRTEVQHFIDSKYGAGTAASAGWKKMAEGTLSDKVNPFVATVLQDMSIIRMSRVNAAKLAAIDTLAPKGTAPLAKRGEGGKPVNPPQGYANVVVLRNGVPEYRVVSDFVAKTYTSDPVNALRINKVWGAIQSVYRNLFISKNVPWMIRNMTMRDPQATFKNNPELKVTSIKDRMNVYKELFNAIPEVYRDVVNGERSAELRDMYDQNMLNVERVYSEKETNWQNELDRMAFEFAQGKNPSESRIVETAKKVNTWINHMGQISDKAPKLSGKRLLEQKGLRGEELARRVRNNVGTPDFQVRSGGHNVFNVLGQFYEVRKASLRTMKQAYEADPLQYITKTISMNIMPKLLASAAVAGYFGEDLQKAFGKIQKWDRFLSNSVPLPNSVTEQMKDAGMIGKNEGVYFKIAQDYEGQFFGAVAEHMLQGEGSAILNDLFTAVPLSPHAFWGHAWNVAEYLRGGEPYDSFRQRPVLSKEQQETRRINGITDKKALQGMGTYLYNTTLGAALPKIETREFPTTPTQFERYFRMTPGLSALITISDGATRQELRDRLQQDRDAKTLKSYAVGDVINESIRQGKKTPADMQGVYRQLLTDKAITPGAASRSAFMNRYKNTVIQSETGIKPQSKAEKRIIMEATH